MTDERDDDDGPRTPNFSSGHMRLARTVTDLGELYDLLADRLEMDLRCELSGNPCGTDAHMVGFPCQCPMCCAHRGCRRVIIIPARRCDRGTIGCEDPHEQESGESEPVNPEAARCRARAAQCRTLAVRFGVWAKLSDNIIAYEREKFTRDLQVLAEELGMTAKRFGVDLQKLKLKS